jgi:hypothetical protein
VRPDSSSVGRLIEVGVYARDGECCGETEPGRGRVDDTLVMGGEFDTLAWAYSCCRLALTAVRRRVVVVASRAWQSLTSSLNLVFRSCGCQSGNTDKLNKGKTKHRVTAERKVYSFDRNEDVPSNPYRPIYFEFHQGQNYPKVANLFRCTYFSGSK